VCRRHGSSAWRWCLRWSSGSDVALAVEGDDADGAELVGIGSFEEGDGLGGWRGCSGGAGRDGLVLLFKFADELLPAVFGEEE
jgi:hypothetical protein